MTRRSIRGLMLLGVMLSLAACAGMMAPAPPSLYQRLDRKSVV